MWSPRQQYVFFSLLLFLAIFNMFILYFSYILNKFLSFSYLICLFQLLLSKYNFCYRYRYKAMLPVPSPYYHYSYHVTMAQQHLIHVDVDLQWLLTFVEHFSAVYWMITLPSCHLPAYLHICTDLKQ